MGQVAGKELTFQFRKPVKSALVWWLRFFGVVAFVVLLLRLPTSEGVQLTRIDLRWLGFCMVLTVLQLLLEAFVWQLLLARQRIRQAYPKTLVAYLASQYLGLVTPGHVGDLLAAGYISMNTGITFGYALSSVVMKKVLNWIVIVGFGLWGLQLLAAFPLIQGLQRVALVSVAVLGILAVGISIWIVSLRKLAKKWRKLSPWQIDMTEFWAGMRTLSSPKLIVPLLVTALAFTILFYQFDAILRSLGIALPIVLTSQIMACSRIIGRIIPISMVGFGSKDLATITVLEWQGIDPSVGLTATLLLLLCSYLVTLLLSGLCWWVKPLIVRRVRATHS